MKYGPTGEAMRRYSSSWAERTPRKGSVAIMNGRRYRLEPGTEGTQRASAAARAARDATKSSSGSSGMARRRAEALKRAALNPGRNVQTEPSACRYALRPSKISWP
nr:hypothetical protein DA06_04730 [Georgenia sp. SUBG003]